MSKEGNKSISVIKEGYKSISVIIYMLWLYKNIWHLGIHHEILGCVIKKQS